MGGSMSGEILTAVIAAGGSVVLAGASYWFTKKREREADLRKEKLEHYKDFVQALSGIISGESSPDDQRVFSRACNRLNLVGSQSVLEALQQFQQEIKVANTSRSQERHDQLMSKLFFEIRKDLAVKPADRTETFRVGLWAAGAPRSQDERGIKGNA
ncbi:hypothetical protein CDL60_26230 [Roseateles noduli]|nr:hypothetical protein CDL60_26230 [Roseateles noduli]